MAASGRRVRVDAALVSAAMLGGNVLSYLLNVVAARSLAPPVYGELGSLLAVFVVGTVPAMALQTVAALHVARGRARAAATAAAGESGAGRSGAGGSGAATAAPGAATDRAAPGGHATDGDRRDLAAREGELLRVGLVVAAVVAGVAALSTPALAALLHLPTPVTVVWLALALAPLTLTGVNNGTLQGRGRFGALAVVVAVDAVSRTGGALVALIVWRTTTATLAGMAVGALVGAVTGWVLCGRRVPRGRALPLAREVAHAGSALLGLVLLVNVDVVLARHHLAPAEAGDYAVGAVLTKIAFWLPQAVAVIALPRLADARGRRRTVALGLAVVAALDAVVVLGVAATGGLAIRLVGGPGYGEHVAAAWLFAVLGSLLALVQLLLFSRIASADRRAAVTVWAAVAAEVTLVWLWLGDSVTHVATAAASTAALLVASGLLIERRTPAPPAGPVAAVPPTGPDAGAARVVAPPPTGA